MTTTWKEFLHDSAPPEHGVQLYQTVDELAGSVGAYLATGFDLGEPALVIATPEHWTRFSERLALAGWGSDAIAEESFLTVLDADATLALFMVDGKPSPEKFERVVGGLLDEVHARFPGRRVRAFGEMVDLLNAQGDSRAAIELEDLWHTMLAKRGSFTLLCGYQVDPFDRATQASLLPEVCRTHSHVLPAEDPRRFAEAVDAALDEVIGAQVGKIYSLAASTGRGKCLPSSQLALMWVSAHMPAHADQVLAAARTHYGTVNGPT